MRATHAILGEKAMPPNCKSPAFKGITITWTLFPRRGLVLHSKIWVWNGPSLTFSFMKTGSSISEPDADSRVAAPSMGLSLAVPEFTTTVPCLLGKQEVLAITHEADKLSNSLSFITLTILPSMQVPIMRENTWKTWICLVLPGK